MELTNIQNFYKNKTILITGATGFIGKALIEKLLRSCSELNKIIVPMRTKKNEAITDRITSFFSCPLWETLKTEMPDFKEKVIFISSNLEKERFEMSSEDYNLIVTTVNIVFHSAATVNFRAPLKEAVNSNIKITKNLLNCAKEMAQLEVFIHVSTLWSHVLFNYVEEKVEKCQYSPNFLIDLVDNLDNNLINTIEDSILKTWPNTYTFTKHVSENLVYSEKDNLPVTIVRIPGITCAYREPIPGWVNDIQAVTYIGVSIMLGLFKVMYCTPDIRLNILPVDYTVNSLIATAWNNVVHKTNKLKVYNLSCEHNFLTNRYLIESFVYSKYPLEKAVWTPGCYISSTQAVYDRSRLLYEIIPARICDLLFFQNTCQKFIKKNKQVAYSLTPYDTKDLKLEYKNVPELWKKLNYDDQQLFYFDNNDINWEEYMDIYCKGIKQYLNEDVTNLKKAQQVQYLLKSKF